VLTLTKVRWGEMAKYL